MKSEFLQEAKQDKKAAMKETDAFLAELIRNAQLARDELKAGMKDPEGSFELRALGYVLGLMITAKGKDWWKIIWGESRYMSVSR